MGGDEIDTGHRAAVTVTEEIPGSGQASGQLGDAMSGPAFLLCPNVRPPKASVLRFNDTCDASPTYIVTGSGVSGSFGTLVLKSTVAS